MSDEHKAFLDEYNQLVDKHNVDFAAYPVYTPDGQGGFRTMIQMTPVSVEPKNKPNENVEPKKATS